ncbi:hypothetical protein [Kocuria nitroreducens]|uniref:hypothetical protein n=1 Tax=Kocuria nitroreducens TaxID=3058914 RepID=UPI0036D842DD
MPEFPAQPTRTDEDVPHPRNNRMLTVEQLREHVADGLVDTVEPAAFEAAVTDGELRRGFEHL